MNMLETNLKEIAIQKAISLYGEKLPPQILNRIEHELNIIAQNKWTDAYLLLNELLASKCIYPHEYALRGFGWNSFVAYLLGILPNINPLPAHYRCPKDNYSNFNVNMHHEKFGIELPDKCCPICGSIMLKDGWSLPIELLMEQTSDTTTKRQLIIQIDTSTSLRRKLLGRLSDQCLDMSRYKFSITDWKIYDILSSLPNINMICYEDSNVIKVFQTSESIGLSYRTNRGFPLGTRGITYDDEDKIAEILLETNPQNFSELVKVAGIYHGTGIWTQEIKHDIINRRMQISTLLSCCEDVFELLLAHNIEGNLALRITKLISKGMGINKDDESLLIKHGIASSDIAYLKRLLYLFPRVRLIQIAQHMWWMAYHKIYNPSIFYDMFFKIHSSKELIHIISCGWETVHREVSKMYDDCRYNSMGFNIEKKKLLELALEMFARGYSLTCE